ncbi:hypothetical protein [Streptomyces albus]|uniref:hypothetical protein n=1 Tax=Streptomyces albus TaxID=1888 RepID=UPI003F5255A9
MGARRRPRIKTIRAVWLADGVTGLPAGLAGGRYRCQACRERLVLKGVKPGAKVAPYFSHPNEKACTRPQQEAQLDADTEVVIRLRDTIRAFPGFHADVHVLGEDLDNPSGLPPVIICTHGETTVALEHPGPSLPDSEVLRRRIRAVREYHDGARHVWFLRKDPNQFRRRGSLTVRYDGRDEEHHTVAPTEQQEAIVAAGGQVYWLDGRLVLIPYGVHWFFHPVRPGQDWTKWPKWRSDPRADWRISKPSPARDADCWGLVPIALSSMTRSQAVFRPTEAYQVMDKLYVSQQARHRWRNRHAEELHRQRRVEHTAQSGRPGTPAAEDVPEAEEAIIDVPPPVPPPSAPSARPRVAADQSTPAPSAFPEPAVSGPPATPEARADRTAPGIPAQPTYPPAAVPRQTSRPSPWRKLLAALRRRR